MKTAGRAWWYLMGLVFGGGIAAVAVVASQEPFVFVVVFFLSLIANLMGALAARADRQAESEGGEA